VTRLSQTSAGLLAEGMVLDSRYQLVRVLGTGGMASVWLSHDLLLEREVAVKVMADTLAADPAWIRRFQRESRAAASLNHPNVVPVFDSGADHGRPFLVMRHVAVRPCPRRFTVTAHSTQGGSLANCSGRSATSTPRGCSTETSSRPTCCSRATGARC
jgi:serine/threonine protein kinase